MLKIGKKRHFQKISNPFANPFIVKHCNVFVNFLVIGLISNQFTCSHDILKIKLYKKIIISTSN